ncbi:putative cytochrome P450 [Actinacidiphila reveromycinica]|uniref:Putative cytochrome P450 n=1 Tax=Actinacidiphila reveromycinica TaxID=659352 RepID=A0A7U3UTN2_9ACTN|nr:cytochrome P450 [Streptomyces sp. SN-593]BBA98433.1 putative cytochrome P450 [Streptomyces sp. SN-593]
MSNAFAREPSWDPRRFPPAPRAPRAVQTLRMLYDPQGYGLALREQLGPVFSLRAHPYRAALVCAADLGANREVLTDHERFVGGHGAALLRPAVGAGSLICTPPPRHLRHRKLLLPPFHGERVTRWAERMRELVRAGLPDLLTGDGVAVRPWAQRLALDVILRVVFGLTDPGRVAVFRRALTAFVAMDNVAVLFLPRPLQRDLGPLSPGGRFARLRATVRDLTRTEIALRRAESGSTGGAGRVGGTAGRGGGVAGRSARPGRAARDDVLSMLLDARDEHGAGLDDEQVLDELTGLLLAGYETTATTIAWTLHLLAHHPAERDALIADLDAGSDRLLKATVRESGRLRPAVYYAIRTAARDTELAGRPVPRHAFVAALFPPVHLDRRLWPQPHAFRPARHLDADPAAYSLTPFGGGVRRCIGVPLAQLEVETVLREVLARAVPAPAGPPEPARLLSVTLVPARGARVRFHRRLRPGGR